MKKLWDKLARTNSKYYINSDKGKGITEAEFIKSGFDDYIKHIVEDKLINSLWKGRMWTNFTVLDLGCGIGRITENMTDDFRAVIGIDISGEMIRQARKRVKRENVRFMETDGESIGLIDGCVDFVFSYLVFQHFKERKMVESNFKEVYRVLKPKGIFKVRIRSDKVDKSRWWGGVEYTEQSIGKLIKEVGFKLLKTETVGSYGYWLWLEK